MHQSCRPCQCRQVVRRRRRRLPPAAAAAAACRLLPFPSPPCPASNEPFSYSLNKKLQIDIVLHYETNTRSTALHAALLAPAQVRVFRHAGSSKRRDASKLQVLATKGCFSNPLCYGRAVHCYLCCICDSSWACGSSLCLPVFMRPLAQRVCFALPCCCSCRTGMLPRRLYCSPKGPTRHHWAAAAALLYGHL